MKKVEETKSYIMPDVDIYENDNGFTIFVDIPGVAQEGVNVDLGGDVLTVTAESTIKIPDEYKTIYGGKERRNYRRKFNLKNNVDTEKVVAELKDGVLALNLTKKEELKPKKIKVNAGGDNKRLGLF